MTPPGRHLRVLMTTDTVGGVWIYASTLAQELCQKGIEVFLVTLGPAPRGDQLETVMGISGLTLEITDLALEWIDPEGLDFGRAADRLASIERRVEPDIVHLNSYREAMSGWRAPVVVVAHSCVRSWWRACRGEEPAETRWLDYMANVHAGLRAAERWVAPTRAFHDTISQLYQPSRNGLVIWNGIDAQPTRASKQPFILAAGRQWDEAKNLSILDDIAPHLPWPIQSIGPGTLRGRNASGAALHRHEGLHELSHDALLETMQRASVLASPALYEPFGLTVLEAAAAGCALVLSDIETFRELWDGAALFVDARNTAEWQAALTSLTRNDALREDLQRCAAQRSRRYSLEETVTAYIALYQDVAGRDRMTMRKPDWSLIEARP